MSIELLAPAGSPEALDAAIGEGADSVYLGLRNFNARMRSVNFTYSRFEAAVRSLRRMGKKLYVTVNTVFEQREADRMYQLLAYLASVNPDGLIVQDFGVLAMARAEFPTLKLHASTQMNIASAAGANALSRHGVSRVVLARELSLEELRSIRAETNMELEVFVHGALCVSASGLCLFSSYLGGKSANRGMCTQACRRLYQRNEEAGSMPDSGYYFSPADLQLIEYLPDLAAIGINAIKIEGRMKSADYVGTVVSAYRLVLDAIAEGGAEGGEEAIRHSIVRSQEILRGDFARGKTAFFYNTENSAHYTGWLNPVQDGGTGISLGIIHKVQGAGDERRGLVAAGITAGGEESAAMTVPVPGDTIRVHRSDDSKRVSHKLHYAEAVTGGIWLSIPDGFDKGDRVYLIQTKSTSRRYRPVTPGDSVAGTRAPGFARAPFPPITVKHKDISAFFPEGLYVAVSQINDLYIVQSSRPARVMLNLSPKTINYLLGKDKPPLPFRPSEIILTLDPYFPQTDAGGFQDTVYSLVALGYRQFMVNNLGHFAFFRDIRQEVQLIAGPWLYMFNTWACSFLAAWGVEGFVSPLENNRQNLERTLPASRTQSADKLKYLRSMVFVPVFAWPPLFRIRADLGQLYDFTSFSDNRDEHFQLVCDQEKTLVISQKPFSITDKIPFLQEAGFRRFIIDLSGPRIKKTDYKDLMRAANSGTPLPRVSRFNWKDGFYTIEEKRKE